MTAFCRLYADGLIYRSKRLVNWCPRLQSTIADVEVDQLELEKPGEYEFPSGKVQLGYLYFFDYPLEETGEIICIATTRPETILADVAIAVNPADARFSHLIGKFAKHP